MLLKEALSEIENPVVLKFIINYIHDETDWGPDDEVTDEMLPTLIRITTGIAETITKMIIDNPAILEEFGTMIPVDNIENAVGKGNCPEYDKETGLCKESGEFCTKEGELITEEDAKQMKENNSECKEKNTDEYER